MRGLAPRVASFSVSWYRTERHSSGGCSSALDAARRKRSDARPGRTSTMRAQGTCLVVALLPTHSRRDSSSESWKCDTWGLALRQYLRSGAPRRSAVRACGMRRRRGGGEGGSQGSGPGAIRRALRETSAADEEKSRNVAGGVGARRRGRDEPRTRKRAMCSRRRRCEPTRSWRTPLGVRNAPRPTKPRLPAPIARPDERAGRLTPPRPDE